MRQPAVYKAFKARVWLIAVNLRKDEEFNTRIEEILTGQEVGHQMVLY